jgi:hypothetical protein
MPLAGSGSEQNVGTITSVSQATPFCVLRGKTFLILAIDRFCELMQEEP